MDYSSDVGEYSSLGVDVYGNIHISYYDAENSALKYARLSGGTWVSQTLDANTGSWQFTSLDLTRYPHIVYYAPGTNQLKYFEGTLSGWSTAKSPVNAIGEGGRYVSLALDSGGSPHISFFDGTSVIYTYWDPARVRWYDQTVATIGSESTVYTAIAVDEADGVHLAYADDLGTGHLVYVDGTTWLTNTIETGGHPAHASIDIDSAGFPHIAYQTDAGLRHAWMAATPDLVVNDVWLDAGNQIAYQVQNVGLGAAPSGHQATLTLDGVPAGGGTVPLTLAPGERYNGTITTWSCSGASDTVRVTADGTAALIESNDKNNARQETWLCDTEPPTVTSGPDGDARLDHLGDRRLDDRRSRG